MVLKFDFPKNGIVILNSQQSTKGAFFDYAWSFKRAAKSLLKRLLLRDKGWGYIDEDACPIVYMYRHAVELYLKHIIFQGEKCLLMQGKENPLKKKRTAIHSISILFDYAGNILESLDCPSWSMEDEQDKKILAIIKMMSDLDDTSLSFRYPTNKAGNSTLKSNFKLNIVDFARKANKLCDNLLGCCIFLAEVEDFIQYHSDLMCGEM